MGGIKHIVGREKPMEWSRMWDDFTQEDIREGDLGGKFNEEVEQSVALTTKTNKKKKDLSQIR